MTEIAPWLNFRLTLILLSYFVAILIKETHLTVVHFDILAPTTHIIQTQLFGCDTITLFNITLFILKCRYINSLIKLSSYSSYGMSNLALKPLSDL